jgi:hypothetical protein
MLKIQRQVEPSEVFDLSLAREVETELRTSKWEP